jgi:mRNA interferase YafQ
MKEIKSGKQFKKDLKRYLNQPYKLKKLYALIEIMRSEESIPNEYKPHSLVGNFSGYMECHVESDFLLVWVDETSNVIKLIRLGSHSEIFG